MSFTFHFYASIILLFDFQRSRFLLPRVFHILHSKNLLHSSSFVQTPISFQQNNSYFLVVDECPQQGCAALLGQRMSNGTGSGVLGLIPQIGRGCHCYSYKKN